MKALTTGMLVCALLAPATLCANPAQQIRGELGAFLKTITDGAQLTTRQYASPLEPVRSHDGRRAVEPTLSIVAGRMDAQSCLYQLRIDLHWLRGTAANEADSGGRTLIQKAPCATLTDEVLAVVDYEVAALNRRLNDSGRFAINKEREQVIAAARRQGGGSRGEADYFPAMTVASRVNLRASPSLKAPVLAKLAPASVVELARTDEADWFLVRGRSGYVHASALEASYPGTTTQ
ncbi:SH3 domain-containing protein [Fontimonas sp. SYSU GA230001]|uniref:SH3 domain-containing protein n=1 Tax=Fontimonas sp. SYSU GA230001 TaxID=3142450 RepID=UPI0032B398EA